ncbi:MAG: ACT domain-containing protein [Deltaproteobacteria bacterium]|nr:ACT domain-containing protein [Deltaproteobacteria bacterium]MBW2218296.1 ACT domain-containing protein [Deltaproteobacteria bacterium]
MKIKQISVFLENRAGRLADIVSNLGDSGISIRAISLTDTSSFGILRLIVDDTESAVQMLKERGFTVRLTDVAAVKVDDRPGELGKILSVVENAGFNIEYIYGLSDHFKENAILVMRFDDMEKGITELLNNSVECLSHDSL